MKYDITNFKNYNDLLADTENTWDYAEDVETSYIDTRYFGAEQVEYKIIFGNENIVFIKTGAGQYLSLRSDRGAGGKHRIG